MRRTLAVLAAAAAIGSFACRTRDVSQPAAASNTPQAMQPTTEQSTTVSTSSSVATASTAQVVPAAQPAPAVSIAPPAMATAAAPAPVAPAIASTAPVDPNAAARRIPLAEAEQAWKDGTAYIVDVRTDEQWKEGHVKGAVHIPYAELSSRLSELPKNKLIITYCS